MGTPASISTPARLEEDLDELSDDILAEVVREAEQMVEAQFTAIYAADQRALTIAGIAVTLAGVAIGTVVTKDIPSGIFKPGLLAAMLVIEACILLGSATIAVVAAMPSRFQFPGNEPGNWRPSEWMMPAGRARKLHHARIEQALVLQAKIESNRLIARRQARLVRLAVHLAFGAIGAGILALVVAYLLTVI